jgi:hypothetical protein
MLQDMAYCSAAARVALGGGSTIKLLDVGADYGEVNESVELPPGHVVNTLSWSQDGQVGIPFVCIEPLIRTVASIWCSGVALVHMWWHALLIMVAFCREVDFSSTVITLFLSLYLLPQVLTVGTANGLMLTYLARLPSVLAAAGTKHAMLTSLGEMTVHDVSTHKSTVLHVDCEPSFCSLAPSHLAVGLNNQVWFYSHASSPGKLVNRRSYLGGVQTLCMNDTHAAVLSDGRVLLHVLDASSSSAGDQGAAAAEDLCLPQPGAVRSEPITHMALSHHFLLTATAGGTLCYHMVQDGKLAAVNEYRHTGMHLTHHRTACIDPAAQLRRVLS